MKVVILAGGFGTRLSEYTEIIPKPMVKIGDTPIIWHIMKRYAKYGHNDFYLALGYKADLIKDYFLNYFNLNCDISIDFKNREVSHINKIQENWKTTLIQTGYNSQTGGRLKKLEKFVEDETLCLLW